jgi:hypothetical protein
MLFRTFVIFLIATLTFSGCTRITTGDVGILKHFDNSIASNAVDPGMYSSILDSYEPVDTTLTRATVKDMQPKDSHGVALNDVSVVMTYSLDPTKVAEFYIKTKELDHEEGHGNGDRNTLGLQILEKSVIPYAVQIATEQSDIATISSHLGDYAATIQKVVNHRLSELYPGITPFIIQSVTIPTFNLPASIQKQVNAKAGFQSELETIAAERAVIEQRKALEQDKATVQADALSAASKESGVSVDQVIAWERARAQMEIAKHAASVMAVSGGGH